LVENQHTQRKLLKFVNWCGGELSKIGHNFRKYRALKNVVIKKYYKKSAPKLVFISEKIEKDSYDF
jgi:hypothetical protein